jgi:hypothetical protein
MISEWTRAERLAFYSLLVAIVGVLAAVFIPELRGKLGLQSQESSRTTALNPSATPYPPTKNLSVTPNPIAKNSSVTPNPPANLSANNSDSSSQSNLTLRDALQRYRYEHGWSGGAANTGSAKKVTFYPLTNVRLSGNQVVMNYPWKNGVLECLINGNDLTGTWQQSDGQNVEAGDILLHFNEDFSAAQGWWRDKDTGERGTSYLRRLQ